MTYKEGVEKIADILDGSIDHLDREEALDCLYEIQSVLQKIDGLKHTLF